ncbi:uncharacterized protein LOC132201450 [Neocloeon triangulifer]|uniref:uncharacterized protein LOC132201450 n=1 Tax=Neocloeon triangulifer TaxID=2078957 RepID=UPI00286F9A2A|nr:uncharacterized protein LOC132201450 [Neocloeon triangulifer]
MIEHACRTQRKAKLKAKEAELGIDLFKLYGEEAMKIWTALSKFETCEECKTTECTLQQPNLDRASFLSMIRGRTDIASECKCGGTRTVYFVLSESGFYVDLAQEFTREKQLESLLTDFPPKFEIGKKTFTRLVLCMGEFKGKIAHQFLIVTEDGEFQRLCDGSPEILWTKYIPDLTYKLELTAPPLCRILLAQTSA